MVALRYAEVRAIVLPVRKRCSHHGPCPQWVETCLWAGFSGSVPDRIADWRGKARGPLSKMSTRFEMWPTRTTNNPVDEINAFFRGSFAGCFSCWL